MRLTIDTQLHINPYRLLPLAFILLPVANAAADRLVARYIPIRQQLPMEQTRLQEGDKVAGYKVTSTYQPARMHPVYGEQLPHYGVDIATPIGTRVKVSKKSTVTCWWDSEGGGEVATVRIIDGEIYNFLHLSSCVSGTYRQGETFARTGESGVGTGPHLDVRRGDKMEPMREDVEPFLTGKPLTATLRDEEIVCAIGAAEGTRDSDCNPNRHYSGHIDSGNGAKNLGTFSYQHGAASPEEADQKQLARLRRAEIELQVQAEAKWGRGLSKSATAAALDLWNQSPEAAGDFIYHLPSPTPTTAEIIKARSQSYIDPQTGELDAPGLGDSDAVRVDQTRRTEEVENALQQRRWRQLDK